MTIDHDTDPHRLATAPLVVGVDGDHTCEQAIRWAARTAARRGRRLHIVHALDFSSTRAILGSYDVMAPSATEGMHDHGDHVLAAAVRVARDAAPDVTIATELSEANPAELLIALSESAHMVVLGARSDAGAAHYLGSTLLKVTAHGHGAIVVVHDTDIREAGPVVVAIDGSPVGEPAIATAFAEASELGTDVVAMHAWSDIDAGTFAGATYLELPVADLEVAEHTLLAERLAGWQEKYPDVRVTREVFADGPRHHLADASTTAQLIVVGSRGRGGFRGLLLGSTSTWIMRHAHCPVMVVHPERR
ncbi:universal stress protein [Nocardia arizonensis]|uniref:universal stress protein n=1 Tax=Nocardia arizonensis TaxID=1141647 RepID=UPI0006D04FBF|nr:universal stress protein [Nocardia arizonensis]